MRIISLDGTISLDASRTVLVREGRCIYGRCEDKSYLIGAFETEELAVAVWVHVHEALMEGNNFCVYCLNEALVSKFKNFKK